MDSTMLPNSSATNDKYKNTVLFSIVFLVVGIVGGYVVGKTNTEAKTVQTIQPTTTQPTTAQSSPSTSDSSMLSKLAFLTKLTPRGPDDTKTIFITRDLTGNILYIADKDLSKGSVKEVYKFAVPGAVGFDGRVYKVGNYLVTTYVGSDANDLVIFDFEGKVITDSLRKNNAELSNWIISYNGDVAKDTIMKANLFQIDNTRASVNIDASTGKMVPNSLIKLGKIATP